MEIFDIDNIISSINKLDTSRSLVNTVSNLLKEKEKDLLSKSLNILGKDLFISLLIKSLSVINNGGLELKQNKERKRTFGGVFFYIIKSESGLSKKELKNIFTRDYNLRNQKRIIKQKLSEIEIN